MQGDTGPKVRLVQAPNPGPLTGSGTNTWLIGQGHVAVIDPGPALNAHLTAIFAALQPGERITHILITHNHLDHTGLVPDLVKATGAATAGFGTAVTGRSATMQRLAAAGLADGGEGIDHAFAPVMTLGDGDTLAGESWAVQAIHTPGHAATHLCFATGQHLFSGDHVMGWSSSLISPPDGDMGQYMASLQRLALGDWATAYPGHGPVIDLPGTRIAALHAHRQQREAALLAALTEKEMGLHTLTAAVYHDVPVEMHRAARRNVLAHVIDLHGRNLVICDDLCAPDPAITLAQSFPT